MVFHDRFFSILRVSECQALFVQRRRRLEQAFDPTAPVACIFHWNVLALSGCPLAAGEKRRLRREAQGTEKRRRRRNWKPESIRSHPDYW